VFDYSKILEDKSTKLKIDDVINGIKQFTPPLKEDTRSSFGLTNSAYWMKMEVDNQALMKKTWFINILGGPSKEGSAYIRYSNKEKAIPLTLYLQTRYPTYQFKLEPNKSAELYFRIRDTQVPLTMGVALQSESATLRMATSTYFFYGLVIGGLLILALYNILYYFKIKDSGFLSLSIFILSFAMEISGHMGWYNIIPNMSETLAPLKTFFAFSATTSVLHLLIKLLKLKDYLRSYYIIFRTVFFISLLLTILSPFMKFGMAVAAFLGILTCLLSLSLVVSNFFKKVDVAPYSAVAGFIFIISIIPSFLTSLGLIDITGLITDMSALVLLISLVMLSLDQAERVRITGEKAERAIALTKAKDDFLITMSHELRTPMNAVLGAGKLLEFTELSFDQKEYVSRLNTSSEHMLTLINDILDLSRTEQKGVALIYKRFDLKDVTTDLEKILIEDCQKKKLTLIIENNVILLKKELLGDKNRIQQVLLNLLYNAVKFTATGGVKLIITPTNINDNIASINFQIIDTGIGISLSQQKDLFNPFTQAESSTSRKYGGSGLGLAICDRLISNMGGKVEIDSAPNKGSRFFFTLDFLLAEKNQTEPEPTSNTIKKSDINGQKVLLVDDDEMNRFFGEKLLEACGVIPVVAESGQQALDLLEQHRFDIVLMDVSMPDMDGYETVQRIRQQSSLKSIPIIALTAHAIAGEKERCLAAGMNDYLTKPFDIEKLKDVLSIWQFSIQTLKKG
jgi:signal transduction histidine kinase/CheY-like chemotaxis protein